MAASGLPHAVLVDLARQAVAASDLESLDQRVAEFRQGLIQGVVNATGVLLHTNLGRAPFAHHQPARTQTIEFDLRTGERGSRNRALATLFARLCGAEDAIVVNNGAAAVMLAVAALATGREVVVSRGESVEIGGHFRVPEVIAQSGARLVDVGTTNRTRLDDYAAALQRGEDVALILKVHPSNYAVVGFAESTSVRELAGLGVPVVMDIGSGLLDARTPWLRAGPPAWLCDEPGARQVLDDGAGLVTFSADKLLGGPQAGIIAGQADLVARCARHPLYRALRCGGLVMQALQDVGLRYLDGAAAASLPFWEMATTPLDRVRERAAAVVAAAGRGRVVASDAVVGAGSATTATIPSAAVAVEGDHLCGLRAHATPVVARVRQGETLLDLRTVDPADDAVVVEALRCLDRSAS